MKPLLLPMGHSYLEFSSNTKERQKLLLSVEWVTQLSMLVILTMTDVLPAPMFKMQLPHFRRNTETSMV